VTFSRYIRPIVASSYVSGGERDSVGAYAPDYSDFGGSRSKLRRFRKSHEPVRTLFLTKRKTAIPTV